MPAVRRGASRSVETRMANGERRIGNSYLLLAIPYSPRRLRRRSVLRRLGGFCEGLKLDPIPNSTVKPFSAHGTKSQDLGESVAARPAKHRFQKAETTQQQCLPPLSLSHESSSLRAASAAPTTGLEARMICHPSSVLRTTRGGAVR
jgi:hypothetical protein